MMTFVNYIKNLHEQQQVLVPLTPKDKDEFFKSLQGDKEILGILQRNDPKAYEAAVERRLAEYQQKKSKPFNDILANVAKGKNVPENKPSTTSPKPTTTSPTVPVVGVTK